MQFQDALREENISSVHSAKDVQKDLMAIDDGGSSD
jgi:hypothetical protein